MKNLNTFFFTVFIMAATPFCVNAQLVTSEADDGTDGTLRQEIMDTPAGGEITFNAGVSAIMINSEIAIDKELTITGPMGNVMIDAGQNGRIFNITDGPVILSNLDLTNGQEEDGGAIFVIGADLTMSGSSISNSIADGASGSGGGIYLDAGSSLNMSDCSFTANLANRAGGGIEDNSGEGLNIVLTDVGFFANNAGVSPAMAAPGNGGAIHITTPGEIEINGGTANDNIAAAEGGGFWNNAGTMTVDGTSFDANDGAGDEADNGGGALFNNGGTMTVTNITATNNSASGAAGSGGAILNAGGSLDVAVSTFSGNSANRAGGAIEDASAEGGTLMLTDNIFTQNGVASNPGNGGAVHVGGPGDSNISGGSASGNTAGSEGGAFWNNAGTMTVTGTSFSGNVASGAEADNGGGALFNNGGTMVVSEITATNNLAGGASGSGGAILNYLGSLSVTDSEFSDNDAQRAGGAIEDASAEGGLLTLTDNNFTDNEVASNPGNGGAVHVGGPGDSNISGGTAEGNIAGSEGGAFWNNVGNMAIDDVTFNNNTASGDDADTGGGAIFNNGGTMAVTNVVATNNLASGASGSGGAILNNLGSLTVNSSEFTANSASRAGGAIEDNSSEGGMLTIILSDFSQNSTGSAPGNGGALHITGPGNSSILDGTVSTNAAAAEGGGFWNGTGIMDIFGTTFTGNTALGDAADNGGGALFNNGGTMILDSVEIMDNLASGDAGSGGGLFSTDGLIEMESTMFTGNSANRAGGAIEIVDGDLTIASSDFLENDVNGSAGTAAPGNGGAIHITGMSGAIDIAESTFTANEAANEGGALWNQSGTVMTVTRCTIDANLSANSDADAGGGGIWNNGGTLNVLVSTISGNTSAGAGGGLYNSSDGVIDINACTIAMNSAFLNGGGIFGGTSTTITNTIVALNMGGTGADVSGTITSNGFNIVEVDDEDVFTPAVGDMEGITPDLGPLADNGGSTLTHALLEGSMGIDAGNEAVTFNDQRFYGISGVRDIGAFEFNGVLSNDNDLDRVTNIYPNPATDWVYFSEDINPQRVSIYDVNGRVISIDANAQDRIDVSELKQGLYVISVQSEAGLLTKKVLVE